MDILKLTIKEVSELLKEKKISSVKLTEEIFSHIEKTEPKINAFVTLCKSEALKQAQESDARRKNGKIKSIIDGVPISIKDLFNTKDIKTTAGTKMLEDYVAPYDATVVKRLKDAGAIIIGKNNCDAWAHGSSGENSDFGVTKNPWDIKRVAGGSSSGSAASVASLMGYASIGTDTGGSIRQPAALCGISGLKPTYGRCSRYGIVAMSSSLDCPGPMARSAEDLAILLEIMCGNDPLDSTTVGGKAFSHPSTILRAGQLSIFSYKENLKGLKIGLPEEYFEEGLDSKIKEKIMQAVKELENCGAEIKKIKLPYSKYSLEVYYIIQPAEVSSNLARYDGIRFGYSIEKNKQNNIQLEDLSDLYKINRGEGFGSEAKRRIIIGTYVLSSGYYDAYYKKAIKARSKIIKDFEDAFKQVDVIITPTSPQTAFKIGEKSNNPLEMYLSDIYTVSANIAGIPGVSIPCGFINNLPVGMQILGNSFSEEQILGLASFYQNITDWHKKVPEL